MTALPFEIETLATGNELLDGSTLDRHTQSFALALRPFGLRIARAGVVDDDPDKIRLALTDAAIRSRLVLVTGGLGPTTDDRTLEVAAKAFGMELVESRDAKANVLRRVRLLKRKLNVGHKKQMWIPKGARVLANDEGTAPAIHWRVGDRDLFFFPGVPREFRHCLNRHLIPWIRRHAVPSEGEHLFTLKVFGWAESHLNAMMKKIPMPRGCEVGFRTTLPENHIKLCLRAKSRELAKKKLSASIKKIRQRLGEALFSDDGRAFEEVIVQDFTRARKTLVFAESCTGGILASMITRVAGSSKVLDRGFVTYSNDSKIDLLGVDPMTIKKRGAVSREVVLEMLRGAFVRSAATHGAAISGVAGPTGGTKQKPVGTIWIAIGNRKKQKAFQLQLPFDRELNQRYSAYAALQELRKL